MRRLVRSPIAIIQNTNLVYQRRASILQLRRIWSLEVILDSERIIASTVVVGRRITIWREILEISG